MLLLRCLLMSSHRNQCCHLPTRSLRGAAHAVEGYAGSYQAAVDAWVFELFSGKYGYPHGTKHGWLENEITLPCLIAGGYINQQ